MTNTSPERMAAIREASEGWLEDWLTRNPGKQAILDLLAKVAELEAFIDKVDAIRNSIIGRQGFNWSMHAYPLVAALKEIGREGEGYEVAKKKAEAEAERWTQELESKHIAELTEQRDGFAARIDDLEAQQDGANSRIAELEAEVAELKEAATVRMIADAGIGTEPIGIKLKKHLEDTVAEQKITIDNLLERLTAKAKDAPK